MNENPNPNPDPTPPARRRRPRYSGTHPRRFHEKYKELNPQKYQEAVAHILATGKTPAGTHRPILVPEILAVLKPQPGDLIADCTLGYGGHSQHLLQAVQPGGNLLALDADPIELPKAEERLRSLVPLANPGQLITRRSNFAGLSRVLADLGWLQVDAILADLGVSSMQLDNPDRGFSWKTRGPLDLRMNPGRGQPASAWLAQATEESIAHILSSHADEPRALPLAKALIQARTRSPAKTTLDLAQQVREWMATQRPQPTRDQTERTLQRLFQALRIVVNDEFGALDALLRDLPLCLKPAGRVAILTFHSGEDRRVKHAFKTGLDTGIYSSIAQEVIVAGPEERRENPRSSPAKLRWAIRA